MGLFSEEQRRGAVVLLPLLVVVVLLATLAEQRKKEGGNESNRASKEEPVALKPFNPNTFEYEELREAGLSSEVAAAMVRWRRYGKVYRIKEDVALVGGVTDSIYASLKPYIVIADSLSPKPFNKPEKPEKQFGGQSTKRAAKPRESEKTPEVKLQKFKIDTASVEYLATIGFSRRQAEVVVKYRDAVGGSFTKEQFKECYVVSEQMAQRLLPYIIFSDRAIEQASRSMAEQPEKRAVNEKLELNSADSAALIAVNGIGPKSVVDILRYRELLGGYHSVEQLAELKTVTEQNYERFFEIFYCDSCKIKKIDINFAGPKELERHPYVSARALRRIVKQRQLKGGWSRIEEMTEQNILSDEEAKRLAPYLRFRLSATE